MYFASIYFLGYTVHSKGLGAALSATLPSLFSLAPLQTCPIPVSDKLTDFTYHLLSVQKEVENDPKEKGNLTLLSDMNYMMILQDLFFGSFHLLAWFQIITIGAALWLPGVI